jgi:hypothetical protein
MHSNQSRWYADTRFLVTAYIILLLRHLILSSVSTPAPYLGYLNITKSLNLLLSCRCLMDGNE